MAVQYRYENQNPMPVVVPGQRGVGVTFNRGQWTTDAWFSRFVGPRQLTRVAVTSTGDPLRLAPPTRPVPPTPRVAAPAPISRPMLSTLIRNAEESTVNWMKKDGIYYCRHCELFRTGSQVAMRSHLSSYHDLSIEDPAPELETPEVSTVVEPVAPVELAAPTAPVEPAGPTELTRTPVVGGELQATPMVRYTCPHCERQYKSELGLSKHVAEKHSSGV